MPSDSTILTGPGHVEHPEATSLRVQLVRGSLTVLPGDRPGVDVQVAALSGQPLEVSVEGGKVSVGYPTIGWDGWVKRVATADGTDDAVVIVRVGLGVAISAATVAAAVTVSGTQEDLELVTASGPVRVEHAVGGLKARTASGPVRVTAHRGPVSAVTAAGDVHLDGELSRASVTTVAGAVDVRHRGRAAVISATTVSGKIDVQLPTGCDVEVESRGVGATVTVDGVKRASGFGVKRVEPSGSGERVVVTATTVTGNVTVDRSGPGAITDAPGR